MSQSRLQTDVCVLGGGPAGASLARRLSQLGHAVVVVERAAFPRAHVGESLVGEVLPLLDVLGMREQVEGAGFLRPSAAIVRWVGQAERRQSYGAPGFQVDRGRFDQLLLQAAAESGARVLQPARAVRTRQGDGGNWQTVVQGQSVELLVESRFVADATGRAGLLPGTKRRVSKKTLALYAYWQNAGCDGAETRVESGDEVWYWGAPLPGGEFNATVFVDPARYRAGVSESGSREAFYQALIADSELLSDCLKGERREAVRVCDATPFADDSPVSADTIKVGESAFAIDPLSSQGVQTAIGSALHAAAVLHTMTHRPDDAELAMDFYRRRQFDSVALHAEAAGRFYAEAARTKPKAFWQDRAVAAPPDRPARPNPALTACTGIQLASSVRFETVPTLQGEFIVSAAAINSPVVTRPIAFLGGVAIVPLASLIQSPIAAGDLLNIWAQRIPPDRAAVILNWLWGAGIYAPAQDAERHNSD